MYDILAIIILVVMMLFWMMVLRPPVKQDSYTVENEIKFLDGQDNLMLFLKTPIMDTDLLGYIEEGSKENDPILISLINNMTSEVFGPVCWELQVNEETHTKTKCKDILDTELMDSEILVPFDEPMKIKFTVMGYT